MSGRLRFSVLLCACAVASGSAQTPAIDRIAWMRGCWVSVSGDRTVEEQWMAPRGGGMIGMSRTVRSGQLVGHEFMVIRDTGGQLVYEAHPSEQPVTLFRSIAVEESSIVFENAQHDFPQRVGYARVGPDSLLAWIEGTQGGRMRRSDFPYQRAACGR